MKRSIFSSLLFLLFYLFQAVPAQESSALQKDDSMVVNSGEAHYDGKEITLTGQVAVQHSLGQISARRLSVQPSFENKKNKFGLLKIAGDVDILLKEGGKLHCQQAEIDYAKMHGTFLGDADAPDVTYMNSEEASTNEPPRPPRPPVELKCIKLTLELMRESAVDGSSSSILVRQIEAHQQVRVSYNHDHLLLADYAIYQRAPDAQASIAGLLTLTVKDNLPACKMTNLNGDHLSAHVIQLNTMDRTLRLTQPNGILYMRREGRPVQNLAFSARELLWNDPQQTLVLTGDVDLHQNDALHLFTDHELTLSQVMEEGKRTLRAIRSPQNTHISYVDPQKGHVRKIHCPGPFSINHETQEMSMRGSLISDDEREKDRHQVHIDDVLGEMYADRVDVQYAWVEGKIIPGKMVLDGHVRLMNRFDGHIEEAGSILHYGLADRVEYFPKEHEMVLTCREGGRVLFFDKVNNVQMSAPSLKVRHDPKTKKESIQGVGDVRFTFVERELDKLKSYFDMESKGAKSNKQ